MSQSDESGSRKALSLPLIKKRRGLLKADSVFKIVQEYALENLKKRDLRLWGELYYKINRRLCQN